MSAVTASVRNIFRFQPISRKSEYKRGNYCELNDKLRKALLLSGETFEQIQRQNSLSITWKLSLFMYFISGKYINDRKKNNNSKDEHWFDKEQGQLQQKWNGCQWSERSPSGEMVSFPSFPGLEVLVWARAASAGLWMGVGCWGWAAAQSCALTAGHSGATARRRGNKCTETGHHAEGAAGLPEIVNSHLALINEIRLN